MTLGGDQLLADDILGRDQNIRKGAQAVRVQNVVNTVELWLHTETLVHPTRNDPAEKNAKLLLTYKTFACVRTTQVHEM